jgi:hypothetical protein
MKHAAVYQNGSQWVLTSMSRTRAGVWIANLVVHRLATDCADDELGTTLLASLEASQLNVPHPESLPLFHRQLRQNLGLPSFDLFMATARLVHAELSESALILTPHRNRGLRAGFQPLPKQTLALGEALAMGEAIRQMIALCQ